MTEEMERRPEWAGIGVYHAFLVLDGSGSMEYTELRSGKPKHRATAEMVQNLINELHDSPSIPDDTQLTIICYDGQKVDDIRLQDYVVNSNMHYKQHHEELWDPLRGRGGTTPIGRALAFARELAEQWVDSAQGMQVLRAVIYLMSDGMRYPDTEPDGMAERQKIKDFNDKNEQLRDQGGFKGRIRLATVGYYQHAKGTDAEEGRGRELLENLPEDPRVYFETADASAIADYIVRTVTR